MNVNDIKELIELIEGKDILEVEYSSGDEKIRIVRSPSGGARQGQKARPVEPAKAGPEAGADSAGENALISVNSPFVGTFYCAPSPSEKPFVEIGTRVKKGQTIGIVEAMKLMNTIEADADGTIKQVLKKDGDPVEFGEPLFIIDPAG
ncbi:MAG: acetyl-CoA carboxylase biotin carboxyl carrier protein [Deltaproteobacteria bacterium]|nr:acetyl-CoA carboxylase biotin carboxyl carrier protein [Deltaproteobacteria bacterium]